MYWGRKKFNDASPSNENPWPALSSLGLRDYLETLVKLDRGENELTQQFLNKYHADTGNPKKVIRDGKVVSPIGGSLGEKHAGGEGH